MDQPLIFTVAQLFLVLVAISDTQPLHIAFSGHGLGHYDVFLFFFDVILPCLISLYS